MWQINLVAWGGIEPQTQGFSILCSNGRYWPKADPRHQKKNHPKVAFGKDFGNKVAILPKTLVIPIDMAERAGFEPAVGLTLRTLSRRVT